jgi:hypothetical protein
MIAIGRHSDNKSVLGNFEKDGKYLFENFSKAPRHVERHHDGELHCRNAPLPVT